MNKLVFINIIFRRQFKVMLTVSLIISAAALVFTYTRFAEEYQDKIERTHSLLAQRISGEINNFFGNSSAQLLVMGDVLNVTGVGASSTPLFLGFINLHSPYFADIAVMDANGNELLRSQPHTLEETFLNSPEKSKVLSGISWISKVRMTNENIPFFTIAEPVMNMNQVSGVMTAHLFMKRVWGWVNELDSKNSEVSVIALDNGIVVADQKKSMLGRVLPAYSDVLKSNMRAPVIVPGKATSFYSGDEFVSFYPVGKTPLAVALRSRAYAIGFFLEKMKIEIFSMILASVLVSGMVAMFVAMKSAYPVAEIVESLGEYTDNNMMRISERLFGEYSLIAIAFNDMADTTEVNKAEYLRGQSMLAMGRTVSALAHELRHNLQVMMNLNHLLTGHVEDDVKAAINKSVKTMSDNISNILNFAKAGMVTPAPIKLELVLSETQATVGLSGHVNRASVKVVFPQENLNIKADRQQLVLALTNILRNSMDAGATKIELTTNIKGSFLEFIVGDNGPGIPREVLPRVFEPFFSTKGKKGFGIGLSIAEMVAKGHGGRVFVQSSSHLGTEVCLTIPYNINGAGPTSITQAAEEPVEALFNK